MDHVSDIKLIRTDTTLDLSQKAEKGMRWLGTQRRFWMPPPLCTAIWDCQMKLTLCLHPLHMIFFFLSALQAILWLPSSNFCEPMPFLLFNLHAIFGFV
ncbi:hypothetical protein KP509_1Z144100 [Ceratopteris richardii]|nr:hypothetical protein KP509_1Z144100 [Ceratopteris richardii]